MRSVARRRLPAAARRSAVALHPLLRRALLLLAMALGSLACQPSGVPIGALAAHPERYDHHRIAVVGTVKDPVPIEGWTGYQVGDSSGTITVATQRGGAPRAGVRIGVQGEFRAAMAFEYETRPALLEERRWSAGGGSPAVSAPDTSRAAPPDSS